tara:strand:- start:952 stop:1725 length:774 start_codon:yes stop_codon:yes gene_type:complete
MKKSILLIFLVSFNFSFGQIMTLFEAETADKQNMSQIGQDWFSALKSVTGNDNGITMHHKGWGSKGVYVVQWFDDMKDMVETMESQESKASEVMEYLQSKPSDPSILKEFNSITDPKQSSVWEYVPELSTMENFSKLSKEERDQMAYRRFSFINTGMNSGDEFEMFRKKNIKLDKQRGVSFHVAVFKNIFGGKDVDYLTILIDKSRLDYMNNFIDRMEKRRNASDWETNRNRWDLSKFNTVKTEEVLKYMDFKISSN